MVWNAGNKEFDDFEAVDEDEVEDAPKAIHKLKDAMMRQIDNDLFIDLMIF